MGGKKLRLPSTGTAGTRRLPALHRRGHCTRARNGKRGPRHYARAACRAADRTARNYRRQPGRTPDRATAQLYHTDTAARSAHSPPTGDESRHWKRPVALLPARNLRGDRRSRGTEGAYSRRCPVGTGRQGGGSTYDLRGRAATGALPYVCLLRRGMGWLLQEPLRLLQLQAALRAGRAPAQFCAFCTASSGTADRTLPDTTSAGDLLRVQRLS